MIVYLEENQLEGLIKELRKITKHKNQYLDPTRSKPVIKHDKINKDMKYLII